MDPFFIGFLFLLAALFAGVETALNSMRGATVERILENADQRSSSLRLLEAWREDSHRVRLGLMFVQNMTRLSAVGWLIALGADAFVQPWQTAVFVLVIIALVLLLVDMLPRSLAQSKPQRFLRLFSMAFWTLKFVRGPVGCLRWVQGTIRSASGENEIRPEVTGEDIEALIKQGGREGSLDKEQEELLASVFAFEDIVVREVMVPRVELVGFDVNTDLDAIFETIHEKGFSRYPVYEENVDRIMGVFYVKDMLAYLQGPRKEPFDLRNYLREGFFVPETKPINELMRELQQQKVHIAVVVDEFGGTAGLATQENIIEEVFGEIYDEHDRVEEPEIREMEPGRFDVDPRIHLRELGERIGVTLPDSADYDTLGGFVVEQVGRVPQRGDSFAWNDLRFCVTAADNTRVKRLEVEVIPPEEAPEEDQASA